MIYMHFPSKLILVASHNCICNLKSFCNQICDYKLFLPCATKDSHIGSHKNGWFGHVTKLMGWNGKDPL
jgi:hypothetical protein